MNDSCFAYLVLGIRFRKDKEPEVLGADIFGESHPTTSLGVYTTEVARAFGPTYEEAQEKLVKQLKVVADTGNPMYVWFSKQLEKSTRCPK